MNQQVQKWFFLIFLSIVWGSSFILIKKALIGFAPMQLIAIRIVLTGLFLLAIGFNALKTLKTKKEWLWVTISGYVSTLLPITLFAFAQTRVNSATASILNALIPLMTLLIGYIGFKAVLKRNHISGIFLGLTGTLILIGNTTSLNIESGYQYSMLIIVACICNAFNINLVKYKLPHANPLALATGSFVAIILPAFIFMLQDGMLHVNFYTSVEVKQSLIYVFILVIFSTAMSRIAFNKLIQISSPAFSSTSTYLIPVIAMFLGAMDGEHITWVEYATVFIIFSGIYIVNGYNKKSESIVSGVK